jgi:hypothetical protein
MKLLQRRYRSSDRRLFGTVMPDPVAPNAGEADTWVPQRPATTTKV